MNENHSALYQELNQWLPTLSNNCCRLQFDVTGEVILELTSAEVLIELLTHLKQHPNFVFDYLSDLTAYDNVDGEDGDARFIAVYQLFSTERHHRLRVKVAVKEDPQALLPTVIGLWPAANWLEREVFDMYGITFKGHPNLKRILMDERFTGHPLRKEYPIKQREPFGDNVRINL